MNFFFKIFLLLVLLLLSCTPGHIILKCGEGEEFCNNKCVNINSDPNNCGGCGIKCNNGKSCRNGKCIPSIDCGEGLVECNGECVDLNSDRDNCGRCGNRCEGGKICVNGECVCPEGLTDCFGECVDLMTDPRNCGECGLNCGDVQCVNGDCDYGVELECWNERFGCPCTQSYCNDGSICGVLIQGVRYGICAYPCNGPNSACPDETSGIESCSLQTQDGRWWCAIMCSSDNDCKQGTYCRTFVSGNGQVSLCHP